jgi:putative phosphoribosyl transferase
MRSPLFRDRREAGRRLARALAPEAAPDALVLGLARGGVVVAAEVASALRLPLDALVVRKIGHPRQPEYALGALVVHAGVLIRDRDDLSEEELAAAIRSAGSRAAALEQRLRPGRPPIDPTGRACILVDDGLATGATMLAAVRWARAGGARRVVAAVPVGAAGTAAGLRREADAVVCPYELRGFWAVGIWYEDFEPVPEAEILELLRQATPATAAAAVTRP